MMSDGGVEVTLIGFFPEVLKCNNVAMAVFK